MEFFCGWLVHAFFQMFHNSAVIEMKALFFCIKQDCRARLHLPETMYLCLHAVHCLLDKQKPP